jgi:polysaccharide export outer membrane protein
MSGWARTTLARKSLQRGAILGVAAVLMSTATGPIHAQQKPAGSSDLARQNLDQVAAPAIQIKAILLQDPGLMVAVKQWVAQDATDHGQILTEDDLSDAAIFTKLEEDIHFRSVATRLVQQYGFLTPQINPDSAQGKQQILIMQEQAKLVAQQQSQELAQQRYGVTPGPTVASNPACVPQAAAQCSPSPLQGGPAALPSPAPLAPLQTAPQNVSPNPQQSPGNSSSPARTQYVSTNPGGDGDLATLGLQTAPGLSQQSSALSLGSTSASPSNALQLQPGAGAVGGSPSTDALLASLAASQGSASDPSTMAALQQSSARGGPSSNNGSPFAAGASFASQQSALASEPTLVRASNPYANVPSLYDMYLQAVPQTATPERFGLAIFQNGTRDPQSIPMDVPAGPDYVVGPGDGLAIDLWGGVSQRLYNTVDREGRISLPEVGPILVSGKSLADVQTNLQQVLRTQFRDVSVDVSLSRLRTIRIYEVGDLAKPGAYDISSLSTPLNALFVAGGPTARGSMRIVKHYRGNQLVQEVDLYDLLLHGVKDDVARLENGDTVMVPPLGPQVTVEGMVRRPAIYELKDEKTLADALQLAGGVLPAATLRHMEVQRLVAHAKQTMLSLDIPDTDNDAATAQKLASFQIQDGDRIRIYPIAPYNQDAVFLEGHVLRPGRYSYTDQMRVGDLVASYKDLLPEPSTQYAEIIHLRAPDFRPTVQSFDLGAVLDKPNASPILQPMDTVRIFSRYDFEDAPSVSVWGEVRSPGTYQTTGEIHLADAVHLAGGLSPDAKAQDAQVFRYLPNGQFKIFSVNLSQALAGSSIDNIVLQTRDRLLIHRSPDSLQPATVYVEGEVGRPGRYPLTTNMTVADLILVGGGLKPSADPQWADLTRYDFGSTKAGQSLQLVAQHEQVKISAALAADPTANLALHNGDVVTVRQLPNWNDLGSSITVKGEVAHPGTYGIRPGERLSSVLQRAGGFLPSAYAYGAILERAEVRQLEAKQQDELVVRLKSEQGGLQGMPDANDAQRQAKLVTLQQYQTVLMQLSANDPVGRVSIRISSSINQWRNTPADLQIRAGDTLIIPKKPDFVMVTGQVYSPTAVSFRPGRSAKWYLEQSGGPTNLANRKAIFVLRADGSVIGGKGSLLRGDPLGAALQPGDTIVVPERTIGGGIQWQTLFGAAQVASSVASAVFLAAHY